MAVQRERWLMKLLALGTLFIASSVFAQDRPVEISGPGGQDTYIKANSIQRDQSDQSILRLKGNVKIAHRSSSLDRGTTITADEAVYHQDTGEIEAQGNVRVTLIPR
jgi:lipopolysaccharide assembly outer membrane protein LptD (OstA)